MAQLMDQYAAEAWTEDQTLPFQGPSLCSVK